MAIKPILFNTEMVAAILRGDKTQTRRVVRTDPDKVYKRALGAGIWRDSYTEIPETLIEWFVKERAKAPCAVGDILWVRETWCNLLASPGGHTRINGVYYYKADRDVIPEGWNPQWHPSIHMPKEAARLFLKVTGVHVERLQDITEEQAKAEGVKGWWKPPHDNMSFVGQGYTTHETRVRAFQQIWNSTIPKANTDQYGWSANPWVWVIDFELCERPAEFAP